MAVGLRRSDSIADMMPEALRQSRYQMKRCFQRYVSQGKRLMKRQQLLDELDKSVDDKADKDQLLQGFLGYVISSTQVGELLTFSSLCQSNIIHGPCRRLQCSPHSSHSLSG